MTVQGFAVRVEVKGLPGESLAATLRRTGLYGVLTTDSDADALAKYGAGVALAAGVTAEADRAEAAADRAEDARDVVEGLRRFYATRAAGAAVTAAGDTFTSAEEGNLAWYRSDGGGAYTFIAFVATKGQIDAVATDLANIRGPYVVGGAGDDATDDKAAIDAVNVAGTTVDLLGKTYRYVGTIDLAKAKFINGRIRSTTMGLLDFRSDFVLDTRTVTVGAAGTIKRLEYLMPYLRQFRLVGQVYVELLELNTPNDATGSMAIDHLDFYHKDTDRIYFRGPAFVGGGQGVPADTDMPARNGAADGYTVATAKAADLAFLRPRFNASIYFTGADGIGGSVGLINVGGFGGFERIFIENHTRYNLSLNWVSNHSSKTKGGGRHGLQDCATYGGVWTFTDIDVHVTFGGAAVMLSYPINGGGFYAEDCSFYKPAATKLYIYYPKVAPHADMPKYGFSAENCRFLFDVDGFLANTVFIWGPFLHGLFLRNCTGQIPDVSFNGVTQPVTQVGGNVELGKPKIRNADPANTSLTAGAQQPGEPENSPDGALLFVSQGGTQLRRGVDAKDAVSRYYAYADSGGLHDNGPVTAETWDNCKSTVRAYRFSGSRTNHIFPNIINPPGGTNTGISVLAGSDAHMYGNTGGAPDITVNVFNNGNWISQ